MEPGGGHSRQYAAEHGLDLDETITFNDIGVSAFRGKNLKQGALSRLKEAVLGKTIPKGSYLIIESLDRFSRDDVVNAQSEFLALIKAGLNIVTLIDGRVFKADQLNMLDLIVSLVTLARANDESKHKSDRLSQSWANRRAHAAQRKITTICPAWLRLSPDKKNFELIEERAAIVRSIFKDSANGIGNYAITQRLNRARVPHFGRTMKNGKPYKKQSAGWYGSYVAKILNNPAVYGEFQPHKRDAGDRRVPDGPPIADYYPKIVDKELFLRAKQGRFSRDFRDQAAAKGRKGEFVSNLFSGLACCGYCGGPMRFENKGVGRKGGTFLVCDRVRRGLDCSNVRWRYDDFEASFLLFVKELDLEVLLAPSHAEDQNVVTIEVLNGQLGMLRDHQEKTHQLFLEGGSEQSFVARKLAEYEQQIHQIETDLARVTTALAATRAAAMQFDRNRDEINTLIDRLQDRTDEEIYKVRARVASSLRALVERITVVKGEGAMITDDGLPTDERGIIVQFKNGSWRSVHPRVSDDHAELSQTHVWHTDDVTWKPSNDELG